MVRILLADRIAPEGAAKLRETPDVEVEERLGLDEAGLIAAVRDFDGMIIRSGVTITGTVLESPGRLRAIARAGVGVDNVDLEAATRAGVLVMNTPDANTLSTAEHAIAMMLALARNIPAGHQHVKDGQWDRKQFVGTQLAGKTLGIIGLGRIGRAVAKRAVGLEMTVFAFDPFVSSARGIDASITLAASIDELLAQADFITIHASKTDDTKGMIGPDQFARLKPGARIINCARGGIVDEAALAAALKDGTVAGAAIDVYSREPPAGNPLLDAPNIVLTPHLGASTREAQLAVSLDAADALLDYLVNERIRFAVNVTGLPAQLAERDRQYLDLATRMGAMLSPLCAEGVATVRVTVHGKTLESLCPTLCRQLLVSLLTPHFATRLNLINIEDAVRGRGIEVTHGAHTGPEAISDTLRLEVDGKAGDHGIEGTVFDNGSPRVLAVDGYRMDMVPAGTMVLIFNNDQPGVIGLVGTTFGDHGVNIADMTLARRDDRALMVLKIDGPVPDDAVQALAARTPPICMVRTVTLGPVG